MGRKRNDSLTVKGAVQETNRLFKDFLIAEEICEKDFTSPEAVRNYRKERINKHLSKGG